MQGFINRQQGRGEVQYRCGICQACRGTDPCAAFPPQGQQLLAGGRAVPGGHSWVKFPQYLASVSPSDPQCFLEKKKQNNPFVHRAYPERGRVLKVVHQPQRCHGNHCSPFPLLHSPGPQEQAEQSCTVSQIIHNRFKGGGGGTSPSRHSKKARRASPAVPSEFACGQWH